jgi:hypothetical protein
MLSHFVTECFLISLSYPKRPSRTRASLKPKHPAKRLRGPPFYYHEPRLRIHIPYTNPQTHHHGRPNRLHYPRRNLLLLLPPTSRPTRPLRAAHCALRPRAPGAPVHPLHLPAVLLRCMHAGAAAAVPLHIAARAEARVEARAPRGATRSQGPADGIPP